MRFLEKGTDIPDDLIRAVLEGRATFLCGAGVSYRVGLPSFRQLTERVYGHLGESWRDEHAERWAMETGQFDRSLRSLEKRRRLRDDLKAHGVRRVWVDEAEIDIGESLIAKIDEGMKACRYIGVVLSPRSVNAPWVQKELDVAINREISAGEVVVLPILYEKCELPSFLKAKRYADFTDSESYDDSLNTLLRRLRIR